MATFRQKVLSRRPRFFSASCAAVAPVTPAAAAVKSAPLAAKARGPWQACLEETDGAAQQRPYVVMRHDLPTGPECLKGQGGRKRRFGSLSAAEAAAAEANLDAV
ncbi:MULTISPECIES: hypothetical protein [unclassified Paludibacterium]|uniref:hypothetical protein n=1 Tax=unclassified Paludibacterium TaxID=2618429 RepID=UPI001C03CCB5|nr:hypothetical protein [Paludibacterium sp. B53371]BEV72578.1 hypothetical protein THUN1379_20600 [Paludibacterium sp. THUN1379]